MGTSSGGELLTIFAKNTECDMASYKIKQSELDNGIFELLRLEAVSRGFLPDFAALGSQSAYEAAKPGIRAGGKQIVEVFNVGSWKSRGEKNINNIILDRSTPKPARTGVGKSFDYDKVGAAYEKSRPADMKWDVSYRVTYITQTAEYADAIEELFRSALGARKLISCLDDSGVKTGEIWLFYSGEFDTSGADFIERGATYIARNVDLQGAESLGSVAAFNADEFTLEERLIRDGANENVNTSTGEITLTGDDI